MGMNTMRTAVKAGIFFCVLNATEVFATIANPDIKKLNETETPMMSDLVEEHTEELADTLKPLKQLKIQLVELEKEIDLLNQELQQKVKEYGQQREAFKEKFDQDSIVFTLVAEMEVLASEIQEIKEILAVYELKEKQIDKDVKSMLAKRKKTSTYKQKDRDAFDKKVEEGKTLTVEIEKNAAEYVIKKQEFKKKYDAIKLIEEERKEEQNKETLDVANDKKEISDLEKRLADKAVELSELDFIIDNYSEEKKKALAEKKKELSKKK